MQECQLTRMKLERCEWYSPLLIQNSVLTVNHRWKSKAVMETSEKSKVQLSANAIFLFPPLCRPGVFRTINSAALQVMASWGT